MQIYEEQFYELQSLYSFLQLHSCEQSLFVPSLSIYFFKFLYICF